MSEFLDYTFNLGNRVFGVEVISRTPMVLHDTWSSRNMECPECGGTRTCGNKALHWREWLGAMSNAGWYCQSCHLFWEYCQLYICADCGKGPVTYSSEHEGWVCQWCYFIWDTGREGWLFYIVSEEGNTHFGIQV